MNHQFKFTFLITHFGDEKWLNTSIAQIHRNVTSDCRIVIINQNRDSMSVLSNTESMSILQFPRTYQFPSLDHATSLNLAIRTIEFESEYVVVLDNDLFIMDESWDEKIQILLKDFDSILACDPSKVNLSHPCFLVIPTKFIRRLDFAEGLGISKEEMLFDTGRLIYRQLESLGNPILINATPAFAGFFGDCYLDYCVVHVGSVSLRQLNGNSMSFLENLKSRISIEWRFFLTLQYRSLYGKRRSIIAVRLIPVVLHFACLSTVKLIGRRIRYISKSFGHRYS
jgi:hypothetical protein